MSFMSSTGTTACLFSKVLKRLTPWSLPPANKIWGKVIFSEARVSHSVGGVSLYKMSLPVWLPGPMFLLGVSVQGEGSLSSGDGGLCLGVSVG